MTLNEYLAHYDALCEEYFGAENYYIHADRGSRLHEAEFVLQHVYGRTEEQIRLRYESNYWAFFPSERRNDA